MGIVHGGILGNLPPSVPCFSRPAINRKGKQARGRHPSNRHESISKCSTPSPIRRNLPQIPNRSALKPQFQVIRLLNGNSFITMLRASILTLAVVTSLAATLRAGTSLTLRWSIAPLERDYAGTNNTERGIAYNPTNGNVLLASRASGNRIVVLDGATGAEKHDVSTAGVSGGNGTVLNMIGVSGDGVVYAANLVTNTGPGGFKLYRWASDAPDSPEVPNQATVAFAGDPAGINEATGQSNNAQRWGDTMAVRGSGVNTQIAFGSGGTPVVVFTTTDGLTFTPTLLPSANANGQCRGIAFGAGDHLYLKGSSTTAFRRVAFSLSPAASSQVNSFAISAIAPGVQFIGFTTDVAKGWLGGFDTTTAAAATENRLFDISSANLAPIPLDSERSPSANGNGNGVGSTAIGGDRLYVCSTNNGVVCYDIVVTPDAVAPTIGPSPANRTAFERGQTTFTVTLLGGTPPLTYRWFKDDVQLTGPGTEGPALTVNPVTSGSAGSYKCTVSNTAGTVETTPAVLTVAASLDTNALTSCWQLQPGSRPYLQADDTNRSMDYHAGRNRLYLAVRTPSPGIRVLNADTGADIGSLDMTGVTGGFFPINCVAVSSDGRIHACNMTTDATTTPFKVYQWADDDPATLPVVVYEGPIAPGRYGDTLDVRGTGDSIQLLAASRNSPDFAILSFNPLIQQFEPRLINITGLAANVGPTGLSIQFGTGNTIWGTSAGQPLIHAAFDAVTGTAEIAASYGAAVIPTNIGVAAVDMPAGCIAGIQVDNSDNVRLYQTPAPFPNPPPATLTFLDQEFLGTDNGNINGTGSVVISGTKLFALNTNNGIACYTISKPEILVSPTIGNVTRNAQADTISFELFGAAGRTYVIESAADTAQPSWTPDGTVTLTGASAIVTRPISSTRNFFRARLQP